MYIYILLIISVVLLFILDDYTIKHVKQYKISINIQKMNLKIKQNTEPNVGFFYWLAILIVFCFSAFRFDIGWDYDVYYNVIANNLQDTTITENNEILNILLVNLSQNTGITNLYFFVSSLITLFLIALDVSKYTSMPKLSMFIFITFPLFYLNSFSIIRFFVALSITFFAFEFLMKKKYAIYYFCILIAVFFHISAIFCVIFPIIRNIKLDPLKIFMLLLSLPIIGQVLIQIVNIYFPSYSRYLLPTSIQEGTKAIWVVLLFAIIMILLYERLIKVSKNFSVYGNLFIVGVSIYLLFLEQGTLGHRLSLYGTIYLVYLVPDIIKVFDRQIERQLLSIAIYFAFSIMYIYILSVSSETYLPYTTIFSRY